MSQQKMRDFIEGISRLRIPGEIGCPDCGGHLNEGNGFKRDCLNCGETYAVSKLDEWSADEAFDSQEALNRLIGDARKLLSDERKPVTSNPEPTSEECAEIGRRALMATCFSTASEELANSIYDMVANLLHLAHQNDIEPDYIIHMAQTHHYAEVEEEAQERAKGE